MPEHMHHHECAHDHHAHEHETSCGGGGCACGGGGCQKETSKESGCCCGHTETRDPVVLTPIQKDFLTELVATGALPLARFFAQSSTNDDVSFVMLAPVYLLSVADDMKAAKETAAFLYDMENAGLISLDYGDALGEEAYLEYEHSMLYAYFCETVREAIAKNPDFLADVPYLERGCIRATNLGTRSLAIS